MEIFDETAFIAATTGRLETYSGELSGRAEETWKAATEVFCGQVWSSFTTGYTAAFR